MFIYSLYTYTYGFKKFEKYITNIDTDDDTSDLKISDFKIKMLNDYSEQNIDEFILNYSINSIKLIEEKNKILYFDNEFFDSINNILFTKIKNAEKNSYIPRFFVEYMIDTKNYNLYKNLKENIDKSKKFNEKFGIYIPIIIYVDNNEYNLIIPRNDSSESPEFIV
jgi:hypothetical protein